jgi:uncharacterized protein YjcR
MKKKEIESQKRAQITPEMRTESFRYYLMGLTMPEISLLCGGVSVRTLEKWQAMDEWTKLRTPEPLKKKIAEMKDGGLSVKTITEKTGLSKATIHRYINEASNG